MKLGAGLVIQFKTTCWSIKMTSAAIDFNTLSIVTIILAGFFPVDTLIFKANSLFKYPHQPSPHHFQSHPKKEGAGAPSQKPTRVPNRNNQTFEFPDSRLPGATKPPDVINRLSSLSSQVMASMRRKSFLQKSIKQTSFITEQAAGFNQQPDVSSSLQKPKIPISP